MAKEFQTKIVIGGAVSKTLGKALKTSEKAVKGKMQIINEVGQTAGKVADVVGGAMIAGGAVAVKMAFDYQNSLAKLGTIADTSKVSLEKLSKQVLDLSNKTGVAASDVNEAMYQAISAGADTSKASQLVEVAIKAAKGGFTDTTTAVDGLTTVLNSYNLKTEDAEKIANQMLTTQNKGKTTFGELASSIGKLSPITKSAGLSTDEMFSSLAALTANGVQTSEAVSGMKAAMSNIIKPSSEAQKVAQSLGLEFNSTAMQSKGLSGFLQDVKQKTGGNLDTMAKLFGSVEGLNAVLTLTSDKGGALYNDTMLEMTKNGTAVQDAYEKMLTPQEKLMIAMNKVKNVGIELGLKLMPYVEQFANWLSNLDFNSIINKIQFFAPIIIGVVGALKLLSVAIGIINFVINSSPTTWIVLGIVAAVALLVAGFIILWKKFEGFRQFWITAWEIIKIYAVMVWQSLVADFKFAVTMIKCAFTPIIAFFQMVWNTIKGVFAVVKAVLSGDFQGAWEAIKGIWNGFGDFFKKVFNSIKTAAKAPLDWLTSKFDVIKQGIDKVKAVFGWGGKETKVKTKHGTGGTFTTPHIAWIGDKPETIVPHANTPRNRGLLQEAASHMGVSMGNNTTVSVTFAPVISGGSSADVKQAVAESEQEFERKINNYFKNRGRVSFA